MHGHNPYVATPTFEGAWLEGGMVGSVASPAVYVARETFVSGGRRKTGASIWERGWGTCGGQIGHTDEDP